jgi:hypothetical protein
LSQVSYSDWGLQTHRVLQGGGGEVTIDTRGLTLKRSAIMNSCSHLDQVMDVQARTRGCEECLATGGRWVHLRLCLICGHAGCCDSSPNKHATKHFHETKHPIMKSLEPGEDWGWCYVDEVVLDLS